MGKTVSMVLIALNWGKAKGQSNNVYEILVNDNWQQYCIA